MFGIKKNKGNEGDQYICLDVGTEFLKVIVFHTQGNKIVIDDYVRNRQHAAAMKNGTITSIRRVIETVQETLGVLEYDNFDGAIMGIAGELVKGVTVQAKYDRSDPNKKIDNEEISLVAEKIKAEAYKEAQNLVFNHIGDTTGELKNIEMLNYVVIDAELDGFRVEDPIGLTGSEAKIKLYFTFAPILHINYLKSITDTFDLKLMGIVPQPFAVSRAISGSKESNYSSIVIDVGGGTTDIAVIQSGVVLGTQMIAFGGRVFTKRVSTDLRLSFNEAEDFKVKYSLNELAVSRIPDVRESVRKDSKVWAYAVSLGLEEFVDTVKGFPHNIYLCGGGSLLPEIKESLIEFPWTKELPFNRSPRIAYLEPKDLDGIIDENNLLNFTDDVTPASIARFTLEIINR